MRLSDFTEETPPGEAIRQIVEVFQDGYRAAAALRRTAESMSALEMECQLNAIELRMLSAISSICGDHLPDRVGDHPPVMPRN